MEHPAFLKIAELAREPDALKTTVSYLADHMGFLMEGERVLICFPKHKPGSIGALFEQAVRHLGAVPVFWEGDLRWKALLRLAFSIRARTVIGPPLITLGLTKLARANGTPLHIHNVVSAGYPCKEWMVSGIMKGLDCKMWGFYSLSTSPVVLGATCPQRSKFHIRDTEYAVEILDAKGKPLPVGETGEIVIYQKQHPEVRLTTGEYGRLENAQCACGCAGPQLSDVHLEKDADQDLLNLGIELLSWSSILDCRLEKGPYGLEMELVTFPGEKLPKLPSCAKQIIRPWDPEKDFPFRQIPGVMKSCFYKEVFAEYRTLQESDQSRQLSGA